MSAAVTPVEKPYAVSLVALERQTRVPAEEQVTEGSHGSDGAAAWAWDEPRRQAQLAGGA